ncbi:MAG TPA: SDR family NAD(P)-dependent oxidoreductase, partial [Thermoanaerobaculia bacterium]|nr:SDR family NAD(P)-dependent oxidoreductase [Thermoanaerobaculia bacterium]
MSSSIPRESISHPAVPTVLWRLLLLCACLQLLGCATTTATTNRDRVVVLLGASSGFGKGVALELAEQGANVVVAARRTELLEELARECEQRGGRALAVTTDASDEGEVERLAEAAVAQFGRIDVWINLAGIGAFGRFEEIPLADHHRLLDVNVKGVINGSYFAMRRFRQQGAGTLINISSVAGRVGFPYYPSYSASKHAVTGLGVALNQELRLNGDRNIHVSTISPYASNTPWFEHAANYLGHSPSMVLMDPPGKIVDAIVKATL